MSTLHPPTSYTSFLEEVQNHCDRQLEINSYTLLADGMMRQDTPAPFCDYSCPVTQPHDTGLIPHLQFNLSGPHHGGTGNLNSSHSSQKRNHGDLIQAPLQRGVGREWAGYEQEMRPRSSQGDAKEAHGEPSSGKKSRISNGPPKKHSDEEWEVMKPVIYRLYIKEARKLKSVVELMADPHGFVAGLATVETRIKKWGFYKNNSKALPDRADTGEVPRTRTRERRPMSKKVQIPVHDAIRHHSSMDYQKERMLAAVGRLVDGFFCSSITGQWTHDTATLLPLNGVPAEATTWRANESLWERCDSISSLAADGLWSRVDYALDPFFHELQPIAASPGPHFLIFFWRICLTMMDISLPGMSVFEMYDRLLTKGSTRIRSPMPSQRARRRKRAERQAGDSTVKQPREKAAGATPPRASCKSLLKNHAFIGVLLHRLKGQISGRPGRHPMLSLLESLCCIFTLLPESPHLWGVLKHIVEVGYGLTISKLQTVVSGGAEHPVVRHMRLHFYKSLKPREELDGMLAREGYGSGTYYPRVVHSEDQLFTLYETTWALAKGKNDSDNVVRSATELRRYAEETCQQQGNQLRWGTHTRALVFSAAVIAKDRLERLNRRQGPRNRGKKAREKKAREEGGGVQSAPMPVSFPRHAELGFEDVSRTIQLLQKGDELCKIQAAHLCRRLGAWLRDARDNRGFQEQRATLSGLLKQIPRTRLEAWGESYQQCKPNAFLRRKREAERHALAVRLGRELNPKS